MSFRLSILSYLLGGRDGVHVNQNHRTQAECSSLSGRRLRSPGRNDDSILISYAAVGEGALEGTRIDRGIRDFTIPGYDMGDARAEGSSNDRVKVGLYLNLLLDQLYLKPYCTQIVVLEPERRSIL
jgi:hypothetical protein